MGEDGAWSPEIPKVSANVTAGNSEVKDGPSSEMSASGRKTGLAIDGIIR